MNSARLMYLVILEILVTNVAQANSGTFTTLTYNVAGLPELLSSADSDRQLATELISCYVNEFDVVNVQEDFNYHAALYDTCDNHPYRSPTSGGAGIGSGLNTMSRFAYTDWVRESWVDCNGVDCLTPKGFTMARTRLAEGVYVDIYNLHTQAQTGDADLAARRANVLQLVDYMAQNSAGNAIIVMGDTNTRYTRGGDNIAELQRRGFTDVWIDRLRDGLNPEADSPALVCDPPTTSADCEIVDKVLYRDNGYVGLSGLSYDVRQDATMDDGLQLSDHWPVQAIWAYQTPDNRQLSDQWGGPHGTSFNDVSLLPADPTVDTLQLRSASRVDRVEVTLSNGYVFSHGGTGGDAQSLTLQEGEYLTSAELCAGQVDGHTRVFYAHFSTNAGRTLAGGTTTSSCVVYDAPTGWQIVGFHGRSGDEVDKLGVIFAPHLAAAPGPAAYCQLVNVESGLCLDVAGAEMVSGTNVAQWLCSGSAWQKWSYDAASGLVRSEYDPRYCLDNGGVFADGANLRIWECNGSAGQRFVFDGDALRMRSWPAQVVAGFGTAAGDNAGTWSYWGGANQYWQCLP